MAKITVKHNINNVIKDLGKTKLNVQDATITALGTIVQESFKTVENKFVSENQYIEGTNYIAPPNADIPKSIRNRNGSKNLTKRTFFSSKTVISRSGSLLESIRSIIATTFRIGSFKTDDYLIKITKNKAIICAVSTKAAVLERKKTPISGARRIITKSTRSVVKLWTRVWKKAFKNDK